MRNHRVRPTIRRQSRAALARERGLNPKTVRNRIARGWTLDRALTTPAGPSRNDTEKTTPCPVCGYDRRFKSTGECAQEYRHEAILALTDGDVAMARELIEVHGLPRTEVAKKFDVPTRVLMWRLLGAASTTEAKS